MALGERAGCACALTSRDARVESFVEAREGWAMAALCKGVTLSRRKAPCPGTGVQEQ